jgi:sulfur-oxidizing protein SoxZ
MSRALIHAPKTARRGEVIEIRAMIGHPMETGYRLGPNGAPIPRLIINRCVCRYDNEEIFAADLHPAVSANPFLAFSTTATASGAITLTWTDDRGETQTASTEITVT